ncbi:CPBP family intramembrane glutamic endopeptidase [Geomicrobium sediminis]|uniref:Membrane protease YdiL (CAAX protease family) n=1 Tax=Geomicrobium sediminis TaxID=1347788 RepID=A0ABS2PBB1_9BACL|nr:CPBP family intramembrane glutamic endopeptidase [Geomicrobium sediminis]EZH64842.1 hypothetical protein DH09_20225 [Bacillaceae bacterium JMAK1]MBM7632365.1 membrane protease YdiL (CAAX protease family) [Geomicrobium sediminis]
MDLTSLILSSILQVLLFTSIPFIFWLLTARKDVKFFGYIGLHRIKMNTSVLKYSAYLIGMIFLMLAIIGLMAVSGLSDSSDIAIAQFAGYGIVAIIPALFYAFIQTGLSEEIFFRGFVAKRLINKLGFRLGNFVQAFIFGVVHGIMFIFITNFLVAMMIITVTGVCAYLLGWMNEMKSGGSILPSWLIHSVGNFIGAIFIMFNII